MIYRDFVYLDTERIQSIIAQLEEGVLDKVMEGKTKELQGKASLAAGVLASFLPVGLESEFSKKSDIQSSKVLHDYAFNIALNALNENDLFIEVDDWDRNEIPLPSSAFVLARGRVSILDYSLIKKLAENEFMWHALSGNAQQSTQSGQQKKKRRQPRNVTPKSDPRMDMMQQIAMAIDALMGNNIQVKLQHSCGITFAGLLSPEFLREETHDFIFKYGGKPQDEWVMLAQVSQVTEPLNKLNALNSLPEKFQDINQTDFSSATDFLNPVIEFLNVFQEAMASVTYPDIAVTPIALYRELHGLK